jgi:hypothetical protein
VRINQTKCVNSKVGNNKFRIPGNLLYKFFKMVLVLKERSYENTTVQLTPSVIGKLKYSTLIPTANEKGGPRQLCSHYNDRSHRVVQSKIIFFYTGSVH